MNKKIMVCLIIFLLIFILSSISLAIELKCYDDGSIYISGLTKKGKISAKQKGTEDPYIPILGKWVSYTEGKKTHYDFYSEEAQFIVGEPTSFYVKIGKSRKSVICPIFKFSCKALNSTVESCYKRNNTFFAKFMIYNIPLRDKKHTFRFGAPFSFEYALHAPGGRKITHSPTGYSPEFKDINMTLKKLSRGNKYTVSTDGIYQKIDRFSVSYECKRSIFYDSRECTDMPTCRYNRDCMEDEFCKNNTCEKLDCEDCEYTKNHECISYECCENSDCDSNKFCEEYVCKGLNCTESEAIIDHSCQLLNCGSDEHTLNHECVKLECEEYEYATNHTCELLRCNYDEFIKDHKCKKLNCRFYQKAFDHDCLNFIEWILTKGGD